ncbi:type II toxin-antitoxin system death-on-curing family toxin [Paracraurococcus lichenis]|uniref:Type II toxin-antitoxin system death-on-curing family toxin n=1 Tax=Paracraurococcus lichenis TaxID=3064888 RepID=A0ABT9E3X4_9PROT|nr:type II toxin-antitoxin system death-on-curing family toxin [Paracraurococcus sp. LOR1-02]MDO9710853.1 type II toxin-antitoxin system death-on-curing family toxin [Paracraurococcus sp. LOR1-02]
MSSEPVWLDDQVLRLLHRAALAEHGGLEGLRDPGLLESALARPRNLQAYEGESDLCRLAASYAGGIVRNHPFADGNKRTAFIAAVVFLELNGLVPDLAEGEAIAAVFDLAAGDLPEEGFAAWLRDNTRTRG